MTAAELDSLGISIVDKRELILQCKGCGQTWTPELNADGKLSFDYWLWSQNLQHLSKQGSRRAGFDSWTMA